MSLTAGSKFSPIVGVTRDTKGHITGYKTIEYTLPEDKDTTYTIDNSVEVATTGDTATIETILAAGTDEQTITTSLKSNTLTLVGEAQTTNININLTWGTF